MDQTVYLYNYANHIVTDSYFNQNLMYYVPNNSAFYLLSLQVSILSQNMLFSYIIYNYINIVISSWQSELYVKCKSRF